MTTYTLVLVRHGQSTWNLENRFTGWTDVDLSDQGRSEAQSDYVVLLKSGTDSYIHLMTLLLTKGHPERYDAWKESIRRKREHVTTVEGRYEIYR